jgi:hypothetical protein
MEYIITYGIHKYDLLEKDEKNRGKESYGIGVCV